MAQITRKKPGTLERNILIIRDGLCVYIYISVAWISVKRVWRHSQTSVKAVYVNGKSIPGDFTHKRNVLLWNRLDRMITGDKPRGAKKKFGRLQNSWATVIFSESTPIRLILALILGFRHGWNEFFRLRGVRWLETDVSGLPIGTIFKSEADPWRWGDRWSRNVGF